MDTKNLYDLKCMGGLVVAYGRYGKGSKFLVWTVGWTVVQFTQKRERRKRNRSGKMTNFKYVEFVIYMKNPDGSIQ